MPTIPLIPIQKWVQMGPVLGLDKDALLEIASFAERGVQILGGGKGMILTVWTVGLMLFPWWVSLFLLASMIAFSIEAPDTTLFDWKGYQPRSTSHISDSILVWAKQFVERQLTWLVWRWALSLCVPLELSLVQEMVCLVMVQLVLTVCASSPTFPQLCVEACIAVVCSLVLSSLSGTMACLVAVRLFKMGNVPNFQTLRSVLQEEEPSILISCVYIPLFLRLSFLERYVWVFLGMELHSKAVHWSSLCLFGMVQLAYWYLYDQWWWSWIFHPGLSVLLRTMYLKYRS